MPTPLRACALLILLPACGPSVDTPLGGAPVRVQSAFFVQEDNVSAVDGDSLLLVYLMGPSDGCALYGAWLDDAEDATTPEALAAAWAEHMPEEYWFVDLTLRVPDTDADLEGQALQGMASNRWVDEPSSAVATFFHYVAPLDEAYYAGESSWEAYFDYFLSDGGTLTIDRHTPGERLAGRFTTAAVGHDRAVVAEDLTVEFDAERCVEAERYVF